MSFKKLLGLAAAGAATNLGKKMVESDSVLDSAKYGIGAGVAGKISYDLLFEEDPQESLDTLENPPYRK